MSALTINRLHGAGTTAIEQSVELTNLIVQDNGSKEIASAELDIYDFDGSLGFLPEDGITVSDIGSPTTLIFGGIGRSVKTEPLGTDGTKYHITAYDWSTLLDRSNVVADNRPAGETDKTRLTYLMTTYGVAVGMSAIDTGIQTLNTNMPVQKFRTVTLRQAIEQVLGTSLATASYRITAAKRLETWDTAGGLDTAPFDINVGDPADADGIHPETFSVEDDSTNLYNAYYVRGSTAAGSGWFTDTTSISLYGRREKFIDAPDSDLAWKAFNIGMAALADNAYPLSHGRFTTYSPNDGWAAQQRVLISAPQFGYSVSPFDTKRVTTTYLDGTGKRRYDVEFGSPAIRFTAKQGKEIQRASGTGSFTGGTLIIPGVGGGTDANCGDCPPFTGSGITDGFNRADQTPPGTSDSGAVWTGGHAGVVDNQLHMKTIGDNDSYLETLPGSLPFPLTGRFQVMSGGSAMGFQVELNGSGTFIFSVTYEHETTQDLVCVLTDGTNTVQSRTTIGSISGPYTVSFNVTATSANVTWNGNTRSLLTSLATPSPLATLASAADFAFWMQTTGGASWRADNLDIEDVAGSTATNGQTIPRHAVGMGDGFSTVFTTETTFLTGSLIVDVDGVRKTPFAEDGADKTFTLDFAPSSGEIVYASWRKG